MSIIIANSTKSIRLMRETREEMEQFEAQNKHRNFKYLGQVKDNIWLDGENKGKPTN